MADDQELLDWVSPRKQREIDNHFDVQGQSSAIRVTISKLQPGQAQSFAEDLRTVLAELSQHQCVRSAR